MRERVRTNAKLWLVLLLNLAIVAAIIFLFWFYMSDYNIKLYEQNLNDIRNVNKASSQIASELFASHERKLNNILRYLSRHTLSTDELLGYIDDVNADSGITFQLIGADYSGYIIERGSNGAFPAVSYRNKDYLTIQQIVDAQSGVSDSVPVTVEFTDPNTGLRSFARYIYVSAMDAGAKNDYTLLAVYRSSAFFKHISLDGGFVGMATVLINDDGSYALRSSDFKSDNFYKYLYVYNDLTLEETNEIRGWILSNDNGTFRYRNGAGADCAFVYSDVPGTDWHCISCVPVSGFHNSNPDFRFAGLLASLLSAMMALDLFFLSRLNRRLKQSAKEAKAAGEAKMDFLSRMSHDIRTPINVISGMTELAISEDDPAKTAEYLQSIQASGSFLLGLVNDILDMNKVEGGKMELHPKPYSGGEFAAYANAVIRPLCMEKGVAFSVTDRTDGVEVMLDPLRFNQIFFNLLSNAIKFTPSGGNVALSIAASRLREGRAALDVSVSDDGCGMSYEFQKTMFSPFSQEERTLAQNSAGTGLGLAIVKSLVDLMGGSIRVESEEGRGATFFVHLEADIAQSAKAELTGARAKSDLSGRRILLCEDHPLNTKIIVQLLSRRAIKVETAENGKLGLEKFSASPQGWYDAILMDMRMPVMSGVDAAKAIRALPGRADAGQVPIIALTANAYDSDVKACMEAGMNAHMAKPVNAEKLCETLTAMIFTPPHPNRPV